MDSTCRNVSHRISADSASSAAGGHVTVYVLEGLRPSTAYGVRVAAGTQRGEGPYSLSINATTDEDGK